MCRRWTDAVKGDRDLYVDATVILWFNIRSCILVLHVCVCVLKVPFRIPSDVPGDVVLSLWYLPQRPRCGEPATLASGSRRRQRFSGTFARPPTSQSMCTCAKDDVHPCIGATCITVYTSNNLPDLGILLSRHFLYYRCLATPILLHPVHLDPVHFLQVPRTDNTAERPSYLHTKSPSKLEWIVRSHRSAPNRHWDVHSSSVQGIAR